MGQHRWTILGERKGWTVWQFAGLGDATGIIPLATLRSLDREDQHNILTESVGLRSLTISILLGGDRPPLEAQRLQGLGRSITNGQLVDYISDLIEHHPALAKAFNSLRHELNSPFPSTESADMSMNHYLRTQQASIYRTNKAAQGLGDLPPQIRQKPGSKISCLDNLRGIYYPQRKEPNCCAEYNRIPE